MFGDLRYIVVIVLTLVFWGWYKTEFGCLLLFVSFCLLDLFVFGVLIVCYAVLFSYCYALV